MEGYEEESRQDIKQLIREVLEYVKPEYWQVFTPDNMETAQGFNEARRQMEAKIKELGL